MFGRKKIKANETEVQKVQKGFKAAYFTGILFAAILLTLKMKYKEPWTDTFVVIAAMYTGQHLYDWYRDRSKKDNLIYVVIYLAFTIFLTASYFIDIKK